MIEPKTLGFFKWKLMHLKDATYVQRDGASYVYCDGNKINMTATELDNDETQDILSRNGRVHKPLDTSVNMTLRGALVIEHLPDGDNYIVAFIQEGSKKKRQIIMLWVGDSIQEIEEGV